MLALLAGATGLVGRECLRLLVAEPAIARVLVLARRTLPTESLASKVEARVVDFDHLDEVPSDVCADAVFCALGTTMRVAGSRERFRQVDFGYPLALARHGVVHGARHFLLVSALGANARSRVFYNQVKGELEEAVRALGYRSVTIVRPSLLLGDRGEFRLGEEIAKRFTFLVPRRLKPVHAAAVASALVRAAVADEPGIRIIESGEIEGVGPLHPTPSHPTPSEIREISRWHRHP
jgi:uncharacterized protein YbjT (DUF2867 family)